MFQYANIIKEMEQNAAHAFFLMERDKKSEGMAIFEAWTHSIYPTTRNNCVSI